MSCTHRTWSFAVVLVLASVAADAQRAPRGARQLGAGPQAGAGVEVLDFEGFPAGTILREVNTSAGSGPVRVSGYNPFMGLAVNAALIFDSALPTGGDNDLGTPNQAFGGPGVGAGGAAGAFQNDEPRGNLLIIAENLNDWDGDGLVNSPDDLNAAVATSATLSLDFSELGPVTILGLTIVDVEASELPPLVDCFDGNGALRGSATLPATGNNGVAEVDLGKITGVSTLVVRMRGSGAIDELRLRREGTASIAFVPDLSPVDLTPNGGTAALFDLFSTAGDTYFYDTASNTLTFQTTVGSPLRDFPTGISATHRLSAIHGDPTQAGLWTQAGGWLDLGSVYPAGCDMDVSSAWDVRADGGAAIGMLWNECAGVAFHWTQASGLVPLELLGASFPGSTNPPTNRATKIADDGSLVGGFAQTELVDRWPAVWSPSGDGFLLPSGGLFTDDSPGEVLSVSANGAVVAGIWNFEGFYWTQATGVVRLGTVPGGQTYPNAIAAGGSLIFGKNQTGFFDLPQAFVWTPADGMRSLADIAAAHGAVIPPGVVLDNVLAASADGSVVLGSAFDDSFGFYSFVLKMPVSAYGL